jgi:hypothetical protein
MTVISLLFTSTLVCLLPRYKLIVSDFIVAVGYVHSKVLKKLNPLALSIHIPAPSNPKGPEAHNPNPIPSQIVYVRILRYLGKLAEAEWRTKAHPILARFSRTSDLVAAFKNQFHSYSLLRYPFDKPLAPGQSVRSWWCSMLENPDANVLAVSSCSRDLRLSSDCKHSVLERSSILSNQTPCLKNAQCLCLHARTLPYAMPRKFGLL